MKHLSNDHEDRRSQHKNSHEKEHSLLSLKKKSMETETTALSQFPKQGKATGDEDDDKVSDWEAEGNGDKFERNTFDAFGDLGDI